LPSLGRRLHDSLEGFSLVELLAIRRRYLRNLNLEASPDLAGHEKLAIVIYAVLDTLHRVRQASTQSFINEQDGRCQR
jgi:hypothetical protein